MTDAVLKKVKKNNILVSLIPANMTHLFQPPVILNCVWNENSLSGTRMKIWSVWMLERSLKVSILNTRFIQWHRFTLSGQWKRMIIWQQQPAETSIWKSGKRVVFLQPLRLELVISRLCILFLRLILFKMKWCKIMRWRSMVELTQHTSKMVVILNLMPTLNGRTTTETDFEVFDMEDDEWLCLTLRWCSGENFISFYFPFDSNFKTFYWLKTVT